MGLWRKPSRIHGEGNAQSEIDRGLASLLCQLPSNGVFHSLRRKKMDPVSAVAFVLDEEDVASLAAGPSGTNIDHEAVRRRARQRLAALDAASESTEDDAYSTSGRIGPPGVVMVEVRGSCEIHGHCFLSKANFSSIRGNVAVIKGKWMYEVQLGSSGILQIGWTPPHSRFTSEQGVGDFSHSYAYDGKRKRKWNVAAASYGERWTAGDIITCAIDLDAGTISYWRNGRSLGVAFDNVQRMTPGMGYYPGISLSFAERCEVNFGERPFLHPVPGYRPLQAPPPPALLARADFLAGCYSRLLDTTRPREPGAETPRRAAALAAVRAMPAAFPVQCDSSEEDGEEAVGKEVINAGFAKSLSSGRTKEDMHVKQIFPEALIHDETLISPSSPDSLDSLKSGVEALRSEKDANKDIHGDDALTSTLEPVAPLSPSDAILVAAALAPHMSDVLQSPFVVEKNVLALMEAALEGEEGEGLDRLLRLFCATLEDAELARFVGLVVESLGRVVKGCIWESTELPDNSTLRALRLWERCLRNDRWSRTWFARTGNQWCHELESLMVVRQPRSAHDLSCAMPNLSWREGEDLPTVLAGFADTGEFAGDISALADGFQHLEEMHVALLAHLCETPMDTEDSDDDAMNGNERMSRRSQGSQDSHRDLCVTLPTLANLRAAAAAAVAAGAAAAHSGQQDRDDEDDEDDDENEVWAEARASPAPSESARVQTSSSSSASSDDDQYGDDEEESRSNDGQYGDEANGTGTGTGTADDSSAYEMSANDGCVSQTVHPPTHLARYLQYLAAKNAGASRNIPPPGLSPGSAMVSTFFAMLRLLRPFLTKTHIWGQGFEFPAMALVSHAGMYKSVVQASRLGGTFSHLIKEALPENEEEVAPLQMQADEPKEGWLAEAPALPEDSIKYWNGRTD